MPVDATEDRGPTFLPVFWVLVGFSTIIVLVRLYLRRHVVPNFLPTWKLEDYLIVLPVVLGIIGTGVLSAAVESTGLGQPIRFFAQYEVQNVQRLTSISVIFFIWSGCTARAAAAVFLERSITKRSITGRELLRSLLWLVVAGQLIVTLVTFVLDSIQCRPNLNGVFSTCAVIPDDASWPAFYIGGASNAVADLISTMILAFLAWKIRPTGRERLFLASLVIMSSFATTCVVIYTLRMGEIYAPSADWIFNSLPVFVWFTCEQYLVITIPSLYALGSLYISKRSMKTISPPSPPVELGSSFPRAELAGNRSVHEIMIRDPLQEAPSAEVAHELSVHDPEKTYSQGW